MKRSLLFIFFVMSSLLSKAQVAVDLRQFQATQNVTLNCLVQDAVTSDALPYVTVYLIPQGDTTITHFALSGDKGSVKIEDIIPGKYEFNVELIGYKPYKKVYDLSGYEKNLGVIKLEENPEYIDAATITAIGNPVSINKDTIVYNATAFHVGENAMLEDLLKKMPGMEVASDGTVSVNGEKVDKITVGGKTFFFNDPTMAVKNLPAKIVDKIKVIDKKKEDAEFSGVATKDDKEKVMDVELKEEYKKGWFGNAKFSGGAPLVSAEDKETMGTPDFLFNGNALLAGYNEKDQLTILGNGKNVTDDERVVTIIDFNSDETDQLASKQGLETTAQAGANYNTSRIKGFDSNVSVNYNFNHKDAREKSERTSFQQSAADVLTDGEYLGRGNNHRINTAIDIENEDDSKYLISIRPTFSYTSKDSDITNSSETSSDGEKKNSSVSQSTAHNDLFVTRTDFTFGVKDLGKERRSLTLRGSYNYRGIIGNSSELSVTDYSSYSDSRHLLYDTRNNRNAAEGVLTYVEPVAQKWDFQAKVTGCYIGSRVTKDAVNGDDGSRNDYYSAISDNDDWLVRERFLLQWKNENIKTLFGVQLDEEQNVTFSRSLGNESTVGKDKWAFNWAPYAEILWWRTDNSYVSFDYGGSSQSPYGSDIVPALDISNPVQMTAGNTYLRPSFSHYGYFSFRTGNPQKYSFLNVKIYGDLSTNEFVYASWFDADGNRYAVPVNSKNPGVSSQLKVSYRTPLDKSRHFSFSLFGSALCSFNTSYQAKTQLSGLDKDNFNYDEFMSEFWGNDDGDLFYSGASGFAQSRTNTIAYDIQPSIEYKLDNFSAEISAGVSNNITKYTLNPDADINSWDFNVNGNVLYSAPKGWEFETFANYNFYRGYSAGYGDPEFIWNVGISKRIKAVTLNLKLNDIFNQRKALSRTATEDYVQDVYRNVIGRCFLVGISLNFGKLNAKNNQRAQDAMRNMLF